MEELINEYKIFANTDLTGFTDKEKFDTYKKWIDDLDKLMNISDITADNYENLLMLKKDLLTKFK